MQVERRKSSRWLLLVGVAAILVAMTLAGILISPPTRGQVPEPIPTIPPDEVAKGVTIFQTINLAPLDQLVSFDDVAIEVVEPLSRETIQTISPDERPEFNIPVDQPYQGEWPVTPVRVRVIETLKGDLPTIIVVWEKRGTLANIEVDSSDPFLSPSERGLLLMSVDTGRIQPLIFAPIVEGGYMPRLEMTLDEFRALLEQKPQIRGTR